MAAAAFLGVFGITAIWQHAPYDIQAGTIARLIAGLAPVLMASAAAAAVMRPWPAFVAVLFLTPVFDVPQVSWYVGPVQVIPQTIFAVVLGLGVLLRPRPGGVRWHPTDLLHRVRLRPTPDHVAGVAFAAWGAGAARPRIGLWGALSLGLAVPALLPLLSRVSTQVPAAVMMAALLLASLTAGAAVGIAFRAALDKGVTPAATYVVDLLGAAMAAPIIAAVALPGFGLDAACALVALLAVPSALALAATWTQ